VGERYIGIIGVSTSWYENGQMKCRKTYDEVGDLHGLSEWWYPDGKIEMQSVYRDNQLVNQKTWNKNGEMTEINLGCCVIC
jgi:antitoxin component YwqK of YwqJK toxin-antitoxin module